MEERNAAEAAICLLRTELAEARNVANALAHTTPTAAAAATAATAATATTAATAAAAAATAATAATPAPGDTVDKIPFPDKFDGTQSKLQAFTTQL